MYYKLNNITSKEMCDIIEAALIRSEMDNFLNPIGFDMFLELYMYESFYPDKESDIEQGIENNVFDTYDELIKSGDIDKMHKEFGADIKVIYSYADKWFEKQSIYKDIADKEGKLIVANVKRIDGDNVYLEIGGTTLEGLLTKRDMLPTDKFKIGDRVKVYVRHMKEDFKGTVLQVTRTHPNFVKMLLEMEVPELNNGDVNIVGIVREAGLRTNNKYSPFPEEMNRQMVDCMTDMYFAPTNLSKENLT